MCRSLGSINVLQPHAFLPHDFPGNERLRCGSGILAPMNLQPWIERDPFNKEGDFDSDNLIEPHVDLFLTDKQNSVTHSTTTSNPFNTFGQFNDVTFNLGNSQSSRPTLQFNDVNFTIGKPVTNRPLNEVTFTVGKPQSSSTARPSTPRPNIQFNDVTFTVGKPSNPNAQIISNNIDFPQIVITSKPATTKKPQMTISNKIDFSTTTVATKTTKRKRKTTVTTKKPNSSIIDNKVDFSTIKTTKRPSNSPFSKTGKTNSTIVRRSTDKRKKQPDVKVQHRSDTIDLTDDLLELNITRQKTFRNEDNATKYLDNKAITTIQQQSDNDNKTDTTEKLESRINHNFYSGTGAIKQYENYYSYDNDNYRPNFNVQNSQRPNNNYYPLYPPLDEPIVTLTTTKRPVAYMNNRPNYDKPYTRPRPNEKPVISPISNKLSTPFSYDTSYNGPTNGPSFSSSITPGSNYDSMALPLYVSPNRYSNKRPAAQYYSNQPTYATTTKRADFSTFLIVDTTRRTSPVPSHYFINVDRTTRRTVHKDYSISSSHLLQSLLPITPADNYYSNSDYVNIDRTNLTYLISTATNHKRFTNKPTHVKLPSSYESYKPSYHTDSYVHDQDNDDFDGYLRPENTFYRPLTNNYKVSYNDYYKPETSTIHTVKYYFKKNILHKYHTVKSGEPKEGLVDKDEDADENEPTKRDAELNDKTFDSDNEKNDELVSIGRSRLTRTNKNEDIKTRNFVDEKTKTKFGNTFFVPFKLLTRIERPDNWVNTDETTKSPLPDMPTIVNQEGNYARELPKPINAKLQRF